MAKRVVISTPDDISLTLNLFQSMPIESLHSVSKSAGKVCSALAKNTSLKLKPNIHAQMLFALCNLFAANGAEAINISEILDSLFTSYISNSSESNRLVSRETLVVKLSAFALTNEDIIRFVVQKADGLVQNRDETPSLVRFLKIVGDLNEAVPEDSPIASFLRSVISGRLQKLLSPLNPSKEPIDVPSAAKFSTAIESYPKALMFPEITAHASGVIQLLINDIPTGSFELLQPLVAASCQYFEDADLRNSIWHQFISRALDDKETNLLDLCQVGSILAPGRVDIDENLESFLQKGLLDSSNPLRDDVLSHVFNIPIGIVLSKQSFIDLLLKTLQRRYMNEYLVANILRNHADLQSSFFHSPLFVQHSLLLFENNDTLILPLLHQHIVGLSDTVFVKLIIARLYQSLLDDDQTYNHINMLAAAIIDLAKGCQPSICSKLLSEILPDEELWSRHQTAFLSGRINPDISLVNSIGLGCLLLEPSNTIENDETTEQTSLSVYFVLNIFSLRILESGIELDLFGTATALRHLLLCLEISKDRLVIKASSNLWQGDEFDARASEFDDRLRLLLSARAAKTEKINIIELLKLPLNHVDTVFGILLRMFWASSNKIDKGSFYTARGMLLLLNIIISVDESKLTRDQLTTVFKESQQSECSRSYKSKAKFRLLSRNKHIPRIAPVSSGREIFIET